MKLNLTFYLIFILLVATIKAQDLNTDNKKASPNGTQKVSSAQAVNDEIKFKNENGNSIITITDEGSNRGSITLPEMSSAPSVFTNKLYNENGTLKFDGQSLGGSSGAFEINELTDAISDQSSVFLGNGSGSNDDAGVLNATDGNFNTSVGLNSLNANVSGYSNTAIGFESLKLNLTGAENTAIGLSSLSSNTTGYSNTSVGYQSLNKNIGGFENTANGYFALNSNTSGNQNTASGYQAMKSNTIGVQNTANGYQALFANTEGKENTAIGFGALNQNISGEHNTAVGYQALAGNGTGSFNTAVGYLAGTDNNNLVNTTAIGHNAKTTADNQVRIGNYDVDDIGGQVAFSALSDGRYKKNVRENINGIDFIMGLRPVSYNLDINAVATKLGDDNLDLESSEIKNARANRESKREVGFIAQDVEKLVNELNIDFNGVVAPKNDSGTYALRYSQFVVPLVKAMQEQQKLILEQQKLINQLSNRVDILEQK
ncbi:MAG: tail fiber domain-containing protein [Melioribacteraceae bacterium]|nr:tail fiber domain-containing protein [Melioribacteraceae bacterium]